MAAVDKEGKEDASTLNERIDELRVSVMEDDETAAGRTGNDVDVTAKSCEPRLWGFETRELYKLALNFYKGIIVLDSRGISTTSSIRIYLDC